jgi:hypothetical protein
MPSAGKGGTRAGADACSPRATPFGFIPQGGGEHAVTHRCPGEGPTVELIKAFAALLTGGLGYEVPPQNLTIDLSRLPVLPRSRFLMRNVRAAAPEPAHSFAGGTWVGPDASARAGSLT